MIWKSSDKPIQRKHWVSEVAQSCPTLCDPMDCSLCPWNFPGKSTGVGCHFLLQGIFLTQGSNPGLLHCTQILYHWATREAHSIYKESESEVTQSCPTLCNPMGSSLHQAPPSMGFSGQEYWRGLPFPSPGNLPNPGIKPRSSALRAAALTSEPPGKPDRPLLAK